MTSNGASIVEQATESNKYAKLFRVLGKLVPGILISACLLLLSAIVFNDCFESISAGHWPSVVGKIENVSWHEHRHKKRMHYDVKVEYNYSIADRQYHNNTLAFGYSASEDRQDNQLILDKLQHASAVSIRYNPDRPERSTLAYGLNPSNTRSLLLALFGDLIGIFFIIIMSSGSSIAADPIEDIADESEPSENIYDRLIRAYDNSILSTFDDYFWLLAFVVVCTVGITSFNYFLDYLVGGSILNTIKVINS